MNLISEFNNLIDENLEVFLYILGGILFLYIGKYIILIIIEILKNFKNKL